jgi:tetratricopeptide (TPR) repeat protein
MEKENTPLIRKISSAEKAISSKDFKRAVSIYNEVLNEAKSQHLERDLLASCYLNRGFSLRKIGLREEALKDATKSSELNPSNFRPHLNAALIYAQDYEEYSKAIEEFDKAIALNPSCVEALSSRGLTKTLMEDYDGAEVDLVSAVKIEPNQADALSNLGSLYWKRGEKEKAAEYFQRAHDAMPNDSELTFNLALALKGLGLNESADELLKKDKKASKEWKKKQEYSITCPNCGYPGYKAEEGCLRCGYVLPFFERDYIRHNKPPSLAWGIIGVISILGLIFFEAPWPLIAIVAFFSVILVLTAVIGRKNRY